ncbi:MAG: glycosyltransferase family 87 protein [Caulobacteraceae bacterium]
MNGLAGDLPVPPRWMFDPLVLAGVLVAVGLALWVCALQAARPGFGPDFFTLWDAAQGSAAEAYRFDVSPGHSLPFVYPPPLLLFLEPLKGFSRTGAYLIWVALSVGAFVSAAAVLARRLAPLIVLCPPVVFAGVTGQTSLLLGAAILCGLWQFRRPWLAGALLGAALCIKPQLVFLLPAGLLAAGAWRVLLFTGLAAAVLCLVSAAVFGLEAWRDWLSVLPLHQAWEAQKQLKTVSLAAHAGLALRAALVVGGCAATAVAFRCDDLAVRLTVLVAASLLCAPHAMPYDLAVAAPAAVAVLAELSLLSLAGLALFAGVVATPWALLVYTVAWLPPISAPLRKMRLRLDRLLQVTLL